MRARSGPLSCRSVPVDTQEPRTKPWLPACASQVHPPVVCAGQVLHMPADQRTSNRRPRAGYRTFSVVVRVSITRTDPFADQGSRRATPGSLSTPRSSPSPRPTRPSRRPGPDLASSWSFQPCAPGCTTSSIHSPSRAAAITVRRGETGETESAPCEGNNPRSRGVPTTSDLHAQRHTEVRGHRGETQSEPHTAGATAKSAPHEELRAPWAPESPRR